MKSARFGALLPALHGAAIPLPLTAGCGPDGQGPSGAGGGSPAGSGVGSLVLGGRHQGKVDFGSGPLTSPQESSIFLARIAP